MRVNKDQWDALSEEHQKRVVSVLMEAEVLRPQDTVVADPTVSPSERDLKSKERPLKDVPDDVAMACEVAAQAAYGSCMETTGESVTCGQVMKAVWEDCLAAFGYE